MCHVYMLCPWLHSPSVFCKYTKNTRKKKNSSNNNSHPCMGLRRHIISETQHSKQCFLNVVRYDNDDDVGKIIITKQKKSREKKPMGGHRRIELCIRNCGRCVCSLFCLYISVFELSLIVLLLLLLCMQFSTIRRSVCICILTDLFVCYSSLLFSLALTRFVRRFFCFCSYSGPFTKYCFSALFFYLLFYGLDETRRKRLRFISLFR